MLAFPWILVGVALDLPYDQLSLYTAAYLSGFTLANMAFWGAVGSWFLGPWWKERGRDVAGPMSAAHSALLGQGGSLVLLIVVAIVCETLDGLPSPRDPMMVAGALLLLGGVVGALAPGVRAPAPPMAS